LVGIPVGQTGGEKKKTKGYKGLFIAIARGVLFGRNTVNEGPQGFQTRHPGMVSNTGSVQGRRVEN